MLKKILPILFLFTVVQADAVLIDHVDYTTDTVTGLDWYDLSFTLNKSYDTVVANLGSGGLYEGWSIATHDQISTLYDAAGGTGPYLNSSGHQAVFQILQPMWGGVSAGIWANTLNYGSLEQGIVLRSFGRSNFYTDNFSDPSSGNSHTGTALVKITSFVIPEPSIIALMGTGLVGLGFVSRRKIHV